MLFLLLVLDSLIIGCWTLYACHVLDMRVERGEEKPFLFRNGEPIKLLSKNVPSNFKVAYVIGFIPVLNTLHFIVLVSDLFTKEK